MLPIPTASQIRATNKYLSFSPATNEAISQSALRYATTFGPQVLEYATGIPESITAPFAGSFAEQARKARWIKQNRNRNSRRRYDTSNYYHYRNSRRNYYMPYRRGFKRRRYGRNTRYRRRRGNFGRRRRYNKSRARRYSAIGRRNGRLRGLQGPNCVPSTCYCKLKTKFASLVIPQTSSSNSFLLKIGSHDMSKKLARVSINDLFQDASGMVRDTEFSTPAIFPVLLDMFSQVRCMKVSIDIKVMFIPAATNNTDTRYGNYGRLVAYDAAVGGILPSISDFFFQALLSTNSRIKHCPFTHGSAGLDSIPSGFKQSPYTSFKRSYSPIKTILDISNAKDYFNDEKHANTISGLIGSRVVAAIGNGDSMDMMLQFFDTNFKNFQAQAQGTGSFVQILMWGTITHHTYWSRPNPAFNFDDTAL